MVMPDFLPFALPDISELEIAEVVDSLRSGWLTTGPKTRQFETEFAAAMGEGTEAIAVNSATSGLHLALEACGVGPGDEVITTPLTFASTAEVGRYLGATVVFVDVNPDTLTIDPSAIAAAITDRTRAILPVHYAGLPCDMDPILKVAHEHGVRVIEDAAHALPTLYQGRMIGSLDSDATVFSFYATKTLATGEGGMLVTRDPKIAARARIMRLHGIDRDAFDRYTSTKPAWYYQIVAPGFKYNMTDLAASLGIHQLRRTDEMLAKRQAIAARYDEAFADLPVILPPHATGSSTHAWYLYVIRLRDDAPLCRDKFIEEMSHLGIGTSVHFIPLHTHPYWKEVCGHEPDDFPAAMNAYRRAVSLPIYSRMSENDTERVVTAVRSLLA